MIMQTGVHTSALPHDVDTGPTFTSSKSDIYILHGRGDVEIEIRGALVGFATSKRDDHTHPINSTSNTFADPKQRCSACRWFEVRIFTVQNQYGEECTCNTTTNLHDADCSEIPISGKYLVLTYGITTVPGEETKRRASWTNSPYEIIELLTQSGTSGPFMPSTSKRVIAQAAAFDDDIRQVYVELLMPRVINANVPQHLLPHVPTMAA